MINFRKQCFSFPLELMTHLWFKNEFFKMISDRRNLQHYMVEIKQSDILIFIHALIIQQIPFALPSQRDCSNNAPFIFILSLLKAKLSRLIL